MDTNLSITADHPLLDRFQATLKEYLLRITTQLEAETNEIDGKIAELNEERIEIGSNLYDLQQEIDRQKDTTDMYNNQISNLFENRTKCEAKNRESNEELKILQESLRNAKQMESKSFSALDKLQMVERKIDKWQQEMKHELKVSKLVLSKDKTEKERICKEKRQMDLLLLNLEMEVRRSETESNQILEQIKDNEEQISHLNAKLARANEHLDELQADNRHLITSWNEVIHSIAKRDKLLAKMNEDLMKENNKIDSIRTNIETTKKEALKQMEQNENLEQFKLRLTDDLNRLKKQYEKRSREQTDLSSKIENLSSILTEMGISMHQADVENHLLDGKLKSLRREHEKYANEKTKCENEMLASLQDQVTNDQASKQRGRNIENMQDKRRNMELIMNNTEAQLSEILFELEKLKGVISRSRNYAQDLTNEKSLLEGKAKEYDNDLNVIKKAIEIKLKVNDQLNIKLAELVDAAGGKEQDPLQIEVKNLEKSISQMETEMKDDQNNWLRLQGNILDMSEKLNRQMSESHVAQQQLLIIGKKSLKIENELRDIAKEDQRLVREIKNLTTKMDILSTKLFETKQINATEKNECQFNHMKMLDKLRNDEMSLVQLENELVTIEKEIEDLKRIVLDKHHEALSWETKWKMVEEAKRENNAEYAKTGEINAMKSEIHRMEVRYGELKRAQEKLVSDMEMCVHHREHIFDQANMRSKLPHKKSKLVDTMQYRVNELQSKLKQILLEISTTEKETSTVLNVYQSLENELRNIGEAIDNEKAQYVLMQNEIEQAILLKQENLDNIVRLQNRAKRYKSVIQAQQLPKIRNEATIDANIDRNVEINEHLVYVLENLLNDFPEHKFAIQRIQQTLKG